MGLRKHLNFIAYGIVYMFCRTCLLVVEFHCTRYIYTDVLIFAYIYTQALRTI